MSALFSSRPVRARLRADLEMAIEAAIAALDTFDGDADLEDVCEDEGGQCEDEGAPDDREPERFETCAWSDEGDQTPRRSLA